MANHPYSKPTLMIGTFLILLVSFTSCRYMANRSADFADVFQFGAGIVAEDPHGGPWPPSLGIHAQVTEFLNLGAIHYQGYSAEMDGRGFFAGPECRTRVGLGPWQMINIYQDYKDGAENYYKKDNALWTKRMKAPAMRWWNVPAKQLNWQLFDETLRWGVPPMHRGYQYWENIGLEVGLSEPFFTHLGFTLRAGFDASEVADFALGLFCIDFKRDDLRLKEFDQMTREDFGCSKHKRTEKDGITKGRKFSTEPEVNTEKAPEAEPQPLLELPPEE